MRLKRARFSWIIPSTGDENHNWGLRWQCWSSLYEDVPGSLIMMRMMRMMRIILWIEMAMLIIMIIWGCSRISYCSADATFDHVFAFIATNRYFFLCDHFLRWVFYLSPLPSPKVSPLSLFGHCQKLQHLPCPDFHHFIWSWFRNETLECHAFLCPKRKMAQAATLTIAQVPPFELSFHCKSF